ncbi:Trp biosynthesis-associated membrane protein [Nocardiopsis sp. NRRL B-16309]|uniref:Trp biosynthesis-associated membrane protein n=1 Tax=Nocardiopsis sp. NRRL B-16309 TaxID=1519494 RepID=UPI0009E94504|nr:Trp biosynthesis-associated membrane protein [Nocardiopsis sp. NRRL B-16309]
MVAGAALLLAAAGRHWVTGVLDVPGPVAPTAIDLTGADLTGTPTGVGWAGLAAVAGLYAARGWVRRAIGLLTAAGGVLVLASVWSATRPGVLADTVASHAAASGGTAQVAAEPDLAALGPAMAAAGALALLLSGLLATVRSPAWPGMGTRYDRDAAPRQHQAETPSDLWRSLDAGDDPTLDAPGRGDGRADGADRTAPEGGTATAPLARRPAEPKENS